ncbi:hypothetical protein HMPREF1564_1164 [Providencia alcalifaciens R90-1475]|nr:hypothetical protein HMPREF1564_1164 [Providencia alcalifaciens R90-1475]
MFVSKNGVIPTEGIEFYFTWLHIAVGFSLLFLETILIYVCFSNRGLHYFYSFLQGNFSQ